MISLIWAMDQNWLIGKDNELPWHYKEDLLYFKSITKDKTVLMGHSTYLSLKGYYKTKPLPFEKIYVANLDQFNYPDAILVNDLDQFLSQIKEDIFIIGGGIIYKHTLKYADYLYITHILNIHQGNVYFPKFKLSDYQLISKKVVPSLIFAVYRKKD